MLERCLGFAIEAFSFQVDGSQKGTNSWLPDVGSAHATIVRCPSVARFMQTAVSFNQLHRLTEIIAKAVITDAHPNAAVEGVFADLSGLSATFEARPELTKCLTSATMPRHGPSDPYSGG